MKPSELLSASIKKAKRESLERQMEVQMKSLRYEYEREFLFHPTRKFRFDFAFPQFLIALEAEGGTWVGGAHGRGKHYESDCTKYNEAVQLGWKVGRFTTDMIKRGEPLAWAEKMIKKEIPF